MSDAHDALLKRGDQRDLAILGLITRETELKARVEKLTKALQTIAVGKLDADNEHPLGWEFSLAARCVEIACAALRET